MPFPKIRGYLVVERLGSGSYSTVYKAFNKEGKRDCLAIKCVERTLMKGSAVENLITEISLLKSLDHPHIVKMKDFQWDEQYVYIIMEYCNSGDLSKYLKERVVPERLCKKLLRQLAMALQELRHRGIVHMDLKPQNLLLHKPLIGDGDIILKVGDFGFAQYMSDESRVGSMRGSPLYMAPEMFLSCTENPITSGYDAKVDLWSVGVILYECLFGKAPYSSNSYKILEEKIRGQQKIEIPAKSKISADCRDLLESLLRHDPATRITHEDFFLHPFLDMKHMPNADNYKKAADLVCRAVEKDSKRDYESAYHLYCESLRYFVPMVTEESNPTKKNELRNKVKCYIKRAEELKMFTISETSTNSNRHTKDGSPEDEGPGCSNVVDLTGDESDDAQVAIGQKSTAVTFKRNAKVGTARDSAVITENAVGVEEFPVNVDSGILKRHMAASKENFDKLYALCASSKGLQSGLEVGMSAEMYVKEGRLEEALKLYRGALATLLKGCNAEPPGSRRTLLVDKIDEWLREAESIKSLLESRGIQDLADEEQSQHCSLQ